MPRKKNGSERPDLRAHFGLHVIPMTREIAVRDRWKHDIYEEVLADLKDTVAQRRSAAIIGPSGAGKSGILRSLADALPEARYRVHYVKVTDLSKRDFCREIAVALGSEPAGYYGALVRTIQQRCQSLLEQESLRPVILLDEAHDIRPDVLAILRVLTNFEMDSRLVVSVVLAGQSALRQLLRRDDLEAVARRIAHYASLRLLSRQETRHYVEHRLAIAGAKTDLFDSAAHDAVYEAAQGNLRAINRLALKSLEIAAAQRSKVVGADLVAAARLKVQP
ncbi:MAG: AAA family ATPase [Deltaproteobacteria bacterium]|nr:AAA family ATPase [Deltaproteobacteria bacterium]